MYIYISKCFDCQIKKTISCFLSFIFLKKRMAFLILLITTTACTQKYSRYEEIQNPNSGILPLLLNSNDNIYPNIFWTREVVVQEYKEDESEEAFRTINGQYGSPNGINIQITHGLSCYPHEVFLSDHTIVKNSDLSGIKSFGEEMLGSCRIEPNKILPDGASCIFEVRYSKIISRFIVLYESPDIDFLKKISNNALSLIDEKIKQSTYCK